MSLLTPNSQPPQSAAKETAIFLERQLATAVWITEMDRLGMSNSAFVPDEETRRGLGAGEATAAVQCSTPGYGIEVDTNVMRSYVLKARAHRPPPPLPPSKDNKTEKQTKTLTQQQQNQAPNELQENQTIKQIQKPQEGKQTTTQTHHHQQQQQQQNQQQSKMPLVDTRDQSIEPIYGNNNEIRVQRLLNKRELAAEKERARELATDDDRMAVAGERAIEVPTIVVLKEPIGPTYLPDVNPPPGGSICIKMKFSHSSFSIVNLNFTHSLLH